jgi:hypothetical protein
MLLASAPMRARLGASARAHAAERFSLARFRTNLLDLYGVEAASVPRRLRATAAPATLA